MKTAFIACEYNPLHNGHKYHIEQTRKLGADNIVCIMSGNFVQRGDIAVAEKHIRARSALLAGADLVIELPVKYAVSTASLFAEGFVKTAKATGLDGFISFGSTADMNTLSDVKNIIFSDEAEEFASHCLTEGINYPKAKAMFLKEKHGNNMSLVLDDANNILALEYLNAADKYFNDAYAVSVERKGVMHDSSVTSGDSASAGFIRNILYRDISAEDFINNLYSCKRFIPDDVFEQLLSEYSSGNFPSSPEKFDVAAFSRLLNFTADYFTEINNVVGGLENRITDAITRTSSINDLCDIVKTKAFTHSRVRQIILSAVLGITRDDIDDGIPYIRVLGFNDKGRALLRFMQNNAEIPVITNLSQADISDKKTARNVILDYNASKLFNLCIPCPLSGNTEYDIPPVFLK